MSQIISQFLELLVLDLLKILFLGKKSKPHRNKTAQDKTSYLRIHTFYFT